MKFSFRSKTPKVIPAPPDPDLIRVEDFIRSYDSATHATRADTYFEGAEFNDYFWRKPFNDGETAGELMRNFAEVVAHLDLYNGVELMDFGAGTCWSSRLFAYMRCSVTAVDVSANALRAGERIIGADPLRNDLDIRFLTYDGETIGLPDQSMDRIVCLDCFHHVADQAATLAEFHRILRPGGIIAFSEPGPEHSLNSGSQFEMRTHGVIENNIVIADIWRAAQALGFAGVKLSHATMPRLVDVADFDQLISGETPQKVAAAYLASDAPRHSNKRCFFLYKGGTATRVLDSRNRAGLGCAITITVTGREGDLLVGSAKLDNTGQARWLTGDGQKPGQVRLGAHHFTADDRLSEIDYARFDLGPGPIEPGQSRVVDFKVPAPPTGGFLVFDLVAEALTWFETMGSKPVRLGPFDPT